MPEKDFQIHWFTEQEILKPELRKLPILKVDEDALVEYLTMKKTITPFFYTFRDGEFLQVN